MFTVFLKENSINIIGIVIMFILWLVLFKRIVSFFEVGTLINNQLKMFKLHTIYKCNTYILNNFVVLEMYFNVFITKIQVTRSKFFIALFD